jgi:arylsulfatase
VRAVGSALIFLGYTVCMPRISVLISVALILLLSKTAHAVAQAPAAEMEPSSTAESGDDDRPNVLVIVTDQQNRQTLGCMEGRKVKTPALDQLAAEGVLFRSGYCNDPICSPSRFSMLSGVYPTEVGAFLNHVRPREEVPLLSDLLGAAGFSTAAIGKVDFPDPDNPHGFDDVYLHYSYLNTNWSHWYPWFLRRAEEMGVSSDLSVIGRRSGGSTEVDVLCLTNPFPDELTPEAWITEQSLKLMKRAKEDDKPFFINANYFAPHHPFGPVKRYLDMYKREEIELPPNFMDQEMIPAGTQSKRYGAWDEDDWRKVLHHYYAFVSQVDHHIGKLLSGMEELGLADNTLVFFVSDHGDMAGEFRSMTKGQPFEGSIGIPFILRWPERVEGGKVLDAPVSLIDIAPTILEAIGEPIPERFRGSSLLDLIAGEQDPAEREVYVVDVRKNPFLLIVLREGDWKLSAIGHGGGRHRYRLVNLREDPHEVTDRVKDPAAADTLKLMREKLLAFWERESAFVPRPLPKPTYTGKKSLPYKD